MLFLLVKHYTKVPLFNHTTIANLSRNATRKWGMKTDIEHKKPRPIHKELGEDIVYFNVGLFSHFYSHDIVGLAVTEN